MTGNALMQKITSGLAWTYAERILVQSVSFVVTIILARQIAPEHYGVIALVTVFINIANVFVVEGFGNALVQKKNADEMDFSTVFYLSLMVAVALYGVLFATAPYIASFYRMEQLRPVVRVLSFKLIFAAMNSVQNAYIARKMNFKKVFFATLFGTVTSAAVGIYMAYVGYGVWALVTQYMMSSAMDTLMLHLTCGWKPKLLFSLQRARNLAAYGINLLAASLIQNVYDNLRALLIGKIFTASDLAFFNRGKQIPGLIVDNINTSITKTLFPAMANVQDDLTLIKQMTRKSMQISSFLLSPILFGLAVSGKSIITLLLTEQWLPCLPYMQIICLTYLFQPLHKANLQAIKAIGRSDVILSLEFYKKTFGVTVIALAIFWLHDVTAVAWSGFIATLFNAVVNAYPNEKFLQYTLMEQFSDIFPVFGISAIMAVAVYPFSISGLSAGVILTLQASIGGVVYILLTRLFGIPGYTYCLIIGKGACFRLRNRKMGNNGEV